MYSHWGVFSPAYSTQTAIGIILATGNLGKKLTPEDGQKNLYISRDGGSRWRSVKPGNWIYEIGDHGAILVVAKKNEPTTEVEFSWDEGETWFVLKVTDEPIYVNNIVIDPNSLSLQFMVYGVKSIEKDSGEFLVYLDFSTLHMTQCQGVDKAGEPDSDFELWTPYDGRHGGE